MMIAIQGGRASFHDIAARIHFGEDIQIVECATFRQLAQVLAQGQADYALMAIENSIAGSILPNYQLISEYHLHIIGEVQLRIKQNLIANLGVKIEEVRKVMSHYMALLQCEDYLQQTQWEREEYYDTADSVRFIKEKGLKDTAAIASRYAAEVYGMQVLEHSIETNKQNYTRFFVLSAKPYIPHAEHNKATLCFELQDKVGALADVLRIIVDNQLNLTKIQSLPLIGRPNQYTFYVDCEWTDYRQFKATVGVNRYVEHLTILGEYKKASLLDDYSRS
jgi:prephenate dehydratase